MALRLEADFLLEFPLRGRKWCFAVLNFAFGNRPRACVLVFPKRSARMREQKFQFASRTRYISKPALIFGMEKFSPREVTVAQMKSGYESLQSPRRWLVKFAS